MLLTRLGALAARSATQNQHLPRTVPVAALPMSHRRFNSGGSNDPPKIDELPDSTAEKKPMTAMTFIEKAGAYGAQALLGAFTHRDGFDRCMTNLRIEKLEKGRVVCQLKVDRSLSNAYYTLHGGATATLVDIVGTIALLTMDYKRPGVSVDINVSYIGTAKEGETIFIEGTALKVGKRLGFSDVKLTKEDGTVIASGRHTKAI
eukprot:Clim_evm62s207 gene=Clim_evmTU62s207